MKIREIGDVITGKTPMTSKPEYFDGDIMFITPSDIVNGYRIDASVRHISESGYKSIQTNTLSGISVLIGCIGSDMGNVALVQERCATNQQINAITNFCENVNPFYVYYLLSMKKNIFRRWQGLQPLQYFPKRCWRVLIFYFPQNQIRTELHRYFVLLMKKSYSI